MDVLTNVVTSKLWVKGCDGGITFGDSSNWTFYYCVEGCEDKTWHIIFYDTATFRMYLRSPWLDLKVKNVLLQSHSYYSNIFRLILEVLPGPLQTWELCPQGRPAVQQSGLVAAADSQVYYCAPPVMYKDTFPPRKMINKTEMPVVGVGKFIVQTSSGYLTHGGGGHHHRRHFPKTWIPSVEVNSRTFEVCFQVVHGRSRRPEECLECLPQTGPWSPDISNLLVNH